MSAADYKTFVIVNPNSSNGKTGKVWPELEQGLKEKLGPFEHALTTARGHASVLAADALSNGFEMVVSLGGDGTHSEVVNGFFEPDGTPVKRDAILGTLTSGTGGDFRKTFGVGKGPWAAMEKLGGTETRPIDAGRFTYVDHEGDEQVAFFVNILSFGMGGLVDHMVNSTTKVLGGKASFFIATMRALKRFRQQTVTLAVDDGPEETIKIHNVAVANGQYFGGGMKVAPEAQPDDGLFDVVSFEDMSTVAFMSLGTSIYKGKHLAHNNVKLRRGRKVVARSDDRSLLDVDGEQKGILPITIENLHHALRLKV